ncbi:hypothetical protein D3C73_671520 [compost metagenome]
MRTATLLRGRPIGRLVATVCCGPIFGSPVGCGSGSLFQPLSGLPANVVGAGQVLPVCNSVASLAITDLIFEGITIVRNQTGFYRGAIEICELVLADIQLAAIYLAPINVVPFQFAVEIPVVEAVITVDIDIPAVPSSAPDAPVVPVDDGRPGDACDRPSEKCGAGIVVVVVVTIGIINRLGGIARLIEHLRRILRDIDLFRIRGANDDVFIFDDDGDLFIRLDQVLGHCFVSKLLDGHKHVLLLIGQRTSKCLCPGKIIAHHLDDVGVVEKRDNASIPPFIRLQVLVLLLGLQEPISLDDLQREE